MIPPRHPWLLPEPLLDPPRFEGFGAPMATLLARRGFRDDDELRRFLEAGISQLHDVVLMADAGVALDRLDAALSAGERIAIWGDYDADGMTAVAVWMLALRALGADPLRYVPSRLAEGYGLSAAGLSELAARGVTLVMTCDCGVVNVAEVEHARGLGVDVIVTDHHMPQAVLPRAVAVVDPHRADCGYPDPDLTGAGVAYKLACALLARHRAGAPDLAALAAIGTVADMAPMTGESRAIVRLGLEELAATERAGLRALLARACENPSLPTGRDLAFGIAPRINAAGRIADVELAIDLLLATDAEEAERLAEELEEVHRRRRALTTSAIEEARQLLDSEGAAGATTADGGIALRNDSWPAGILGLVAGRLCDRLGRPVAAVSLVGDELRGSVRAPEDFHVAEALAACADHLTKRGGHAGAGGFSLSPEAWEVFRERFAALPRPYPSSLPATLRAAGAIAVDLVLPASHLGWPLADEIGRLAPFGPGHVEPILAVTGLRVLDARRVGADGRHLSLRMGRGLETFDAIAFDAAPERPLPDVGTPLDLVGTLERDRFGGLPRLRIRTLDYAHSDASPLVARRAAGGDAPVTRRIPLPVGVGEPLEAAG
ncbi:MAG TPA: single-stranded-DNA-specific exonuclease RecJ [Candidatus Limnocylindria bacterium]|jgi:single-stranded-DNA-specific exonuclease|nr:single-stranded-DNA-specific exonuclease RecJ [Candidatus Limnocylindria bacterium]